MLGHIRLPVTTFKEIACKELSSFLQVYIGRVCVPLYIIVIDTRYVQSKGLGKFMVSDSVFVAYYMHNFVIQICGNFILYLK